MICEFALEPELVVSWHDRKKYRYFEEKFGLRTGRIISAYPKKWVSQVWKTFSESPQAQDQNAQRNLDALMRDLTQNMIKRRNTFPEIPVWLDRAEAENAERPFHAVLAQENPRECANVLSADKLIEEGHPCWAVPENSPVARTAAQLAAAVAPILRVCGHIVFIDPNFNPARKRFLDTMAAFFKEIWTTRYGTENPIVEIHTGIDRFFQEHERGPNRKPDQERRVCTHLIHEFEKFLPRIIPAGKEVRISLWKQYERGQKLHNRYILTEVCGITFGTGLDQNDDQETAETDDLHLMDAGTLESRWQEYMGNPPAFAAAVDPIVMTGSLKG